MKVGKDLKIVIETLTQYEARVFIECLETERNRHRGDIQLAETRRDMIGLLLRGAAKERSRLQIIFWATAVKRHQIDIVEIDTLIQRVKDMYSV